MNEIWQALAREAGLAASHLAIGITALGKANFEENAYYSQAFFALSIGLERTAKLSLVVDHALERKGQFPSDSVLRNYGHDLRKLLDQVDSIAERRKLTEPNSRLPRTAIHNGIIKVLSDFANNITRYYNLEFVTNSHNPHMYDPIRAWYEQVTTPILATHCKPRYQAKIEANAQAFEQLMGGYTFVLQHSEQGDLLNTVYDSSFHAGMTNFAKPYTRMYVMQITRFLAVLMLDLTYASYEAQLPDIPHLSEFFVIFNNSDDYFKNRKTWSIYSP